MGRYCVALHRRIVFEDKFNTISNSSQRFKVFSLHQENTESRKILEQKPLFQIGTLNPRGTTNAPSIQLNFYVNMFPPRTELQWYKLQTTHNPLIHSDEGAGDRNIVFFFHLPGGGRERTGGRRGAKDNREQEGCIRREMKEREMVVLIKEREAES